VLARCGEAATKKEKERGRERERERERERREKKKRDEHPRLSPLKAHSSNFPSIPSRPFYYADVLFRLRLSPLARSLAPSLSLSLSLPSLYSCFRLLCTASIASSSSRSQLSGFFPLSNRERRKRKRRRRGGGGTEEVGGSSSRRGAFLFIRHGGLGIKGESRSALLTLRLSSTARSLRVHRRYISGGQTQLWLSPPPSPSRRFSYK